MPSLGKAAVLLDANERSDNLDWDVDVLVSTMHRTAPLTFWQPLFAESSADFRQQHNDQAIIFINLREPIRPVRCRVLDKATGGYGTSLWGIWNFPLESAEFKKELFWNVGNRSSCFFILASVVFLLGGQVFFFSRQLSFAWRQVSCSPSRPNAAAAPFEANEE